MLRYKRLIELKELVRSGAASKGEKKEYIQILYENGNITKEQYDQFIKGENADELLKAALTIGAIVLAGKLLTLLFEKK